MILPCNAISRFNRLKSVDKVKGFKLSSPKFKIGQVCNYHSEFEEIIFDSKVVIIGYTLEFGEGNFYQSHLGEWRYYLFHLDEQLCDYCHTYESSLTAI